MALTPKVGAGQVMEVQHQCQGQVAVEGALMKLIEEDGTHVRELLILCHDRRAQGSGLGTRRAGMRAQVSDYYIGTGNTIGTRICTVQ